MLQRANLGRCCDIPTTGAFRILTHVGAQHVRLSIRPDVEHKAGPVWGFRLKLGTDLRATRVTWVKILRRQTTFIEDWVNVSDQSSGLLADTHIVLVQMVWVSVAP